jgi:hypothetical protein
MPERYGDDELLVVVGLAEQPGVFSVPGLDGVAPFLARRLEVVRWWRAGDVSVMRAARESDARGA